MSSTHGTSGTQGSMRDTVRDTVKDAKDAARESAKAVSEAGSNMQPDLDSLRNEVRRLTDHEDFPIDSASAGDGKDSDQVAMPTSARQASGRNERRRLRS